MVIEPLSNLEKIAIAAFYWRLACYPTEGIVVDVLKDALEAHFGPRDLVDHLIG